MWIAFFNCFQKDPIYNTVKSFIALSCPKQFDKNCISSWNYSDGDIQWSNHLTLFLINLCTIWNRHHHNLLNSPVPSLAHLASKPRSTWLKGNNNFFWPKCVRVPTMYFLKTRPIFSLFLYIDKDIAPMWLFFELWYTFSCDILPTWIYETTTLCPQVLWYNHGGIISCNSNTFMMRSWISWIFQAIRKCECMYHRAQAKGSM